MGAVLLLVRQLKSVGKKGGLYLLFKFVDNKHILNNLVLIPHLFAQNFGNKKDSRNSRCRMLTQIC